MAPPSPIDQAMSKKDDTIIQMNELPGEHDNNSQSPITSSPIAPKPLTNSKYTEWGLNAYDTVLCLIPVLLMVKIGLCILAHHRDSWATGFFVDDASSLTKELIRLNSQLTTAFTIIFVMIVTTFLRRLALWRVQTGESVARLEQFQASSSLPSTLKLILSLRSFNAISAGLVIGWSFYYVGSQASKNEYALQNLHGYGKQTRHAYGNRGEFGVVYQKPDAPSYYTSSLYLEEGSGGQSQQRLQSTAFILAAYSGSTLPAPSSSDMYGNANMPYMDASGTPTDTSGVPLVAPLKDKKGWYDIPHDQVLYTAYSSYAGLKIYAQPYLDPNVHPVPTSPSAVSGSYTTNSSYFTLSCSVPQTFAASRFPLGANSTSDLVLVMSNTTLSHADGQQRSFELWQRSSSKYAMSKCAIASVSIEAQTHCDGTKCIIQKFRPTPGQPASIRTPFDTETFATRILNDLSLSEDVLDFATYWNQVPDDLSTGYGFDTFSATQFSFQLSQILNTFYHNSQAKLYPDSLFSSGGDQTSVTGTSLLAVAQGKASDPTFQRALMRGSIYNPAYVLNWAWVAADFVSNAVMLVAAVLAFWLRKKTLTPDIFGYVSSLTRDNPNLSVPDGGSAMGGLERSRMLKDVRVRIVDVGASDGLGRVALTNVEASDVERLQRGKQYV